MRTDKRVCLYSLCPSYMQRMRIIHDLKICKQEVLGTINRLFSLTRQGPRWKWRVQQFFYHCVCIRYRGNVSTELLPSNDRGSFTEPLPSSDGGGIYFPWYDTGHIENNASNNSSIVVCVFVTAVTFPPSRFLATKGDFYRTEPLPSNYKGIFTEPLPSNDKWGYTDTHRQTTTCSHKPTQFFRSRKVGYKQETLEDTFILTFWRSRYQVARRCLYLSTKVHNLTSQKRVKFGLNLGLTFYSRSGPKIAISGCKTWFCIREVPHSNLVSEIEVPGYRLDGRGVGVRVPVGSRIFSSPGRPEQLWGPPSLLSNE
jgi:hypothetical protein